MPTSEPAVKVLTIVGAGRSGTTVLASILGEVHGFASAGELRWLWERGVVERRPCGCGEIPVRCPVWSAVIEATLAASPPGQPPLTAEQIVEFQRQLALRRNIPRVLRSADGGDDGWVPLQRIRAVTRTAVTAFASVSGARVVVDTSKRSQDAAVLASAGGIDGYVLHIVRDPRAVAHSWRRAKTFTVGGQTRSIGTRSPPSSVRRWVANCLTAEMLRRHWPNSRWLHMRYEDFASQPRPALGKILALLGEDLEIPFEDDHTVLLHRNHIVAGNPSRFTTGRVEIRADEAWRAEMPRREQRLVELATMPLMLRYGYLGRN